MKGRRRVLQVLAVLLSVAAHLGLAYATPRASFGQLLLFFGLAIAGYALLQSRLSLRAGLGLALLLRLLWLPATPALSDDFYRFRWDGLLTANNLNPFEFRPVELINSASKTKASELIMAPVREELKLIFPRLNSPEYYSVYPPVCQAAFALSAKLFPHSQTGFVVVLRIFLLAAEAGTAWLLLALLPMWGWPRERALLYLLHPLAIMELVGNLHFEAAVIFFTLLAFWLLSCGKWLTAALALSLGAATKLVPLLLLPLFIRRLGWKKFIAYGCLVAGSLALFFSPFISADLLINIGRSLRLYFRSFEFNASLYYVLRALGYRYQGYNEIALIGPSLAAVAGLATLLGAWKEKAPVLRTLPLASLLALSTYYLCATTVHPWYLTPLLALCVFTRLRYPLVWGALAVVSYAAYQRPAVAENLWLVGLEYGVTIAVACLEWRAARRLIANA